MRATLIEPAQHWLVSRKDAKFRKDAKRLISNYVDDIAGITRENLSLMVVVGVASVVTKLSSSFGLV